MSTADTALLPNKEERIARRRSLFWRIHFWAALIASPFVLIATLTGIFYIFTPQIEAVLYDKFDHVAVTGAMRPLDESVAAAQTAVPADWKLHSVIPGFAANDSTRVVFAPPSDQSAAGNRPSFGLPKKSTVVYVNPYTASVIGTLPNRDRFNSWAKKLHSTLLQGEGWRWIIELATGWLLIMLLTGIYLWWPSQNSGRNALPQQGISGRRWWQEWHAFLGVALALMSIIILTTGLTWSQYSGEKIRQFRDAIGQAPPNVPNKLHSMPIENVTPLTWQAAWEISRNIAPAVSMQLNAPRGAEGYWRVAAYDRSKPTLRFDLALDAYSGEKLYYSGWDKQTAFSMATAIGIPFHRGEFGWWNQALLLVFGLSVLFSLVSGWIMYFKRKQPGSWGFPKLLPGAWTSPSPLAWIAALVLVIGMPVWAISLIPLGVIEAVAHFRAGKAQPAAN